MGDGVGEMVDAVKVAAETELRVARNGVRYGVYGETKIAPEELTRVVEAVPVTVAPGLAGRVFYFVPLVMEVGTVAAGYSPELGDEAICHRDIEVDGGLGVFISARLVRDTFGLAFELFINVAHGFCAANGVPAGFATLAWGQAVADVRGETSQDAWEARAAAVARKDEKARGEYLECAFADALAIYMLSLAVDFDYAELREREYPLLAAGALADRLRMMAALFPANDGYEFSIRYRRRG